MDEKKQKLLEKKMAKLRRKCERKLKQRRRLGLTRDVKLVPPFTSPRYDDVYFAGLEWLDSL